MTSKNATSKYIRQAYATRIIGYIFIELIIISTIYESFTVNLHLPIIVLGILLPNSLYLFSKFLTSEASTVWAEYIDIIFLGLLTTFLNWGVFPLLFVFTGVCVSAITTLGYKFFLKTTLLLVAIIAVSAPFTEFKFSLHSNIYTAIICSLGILFYVGAISGNAFYQRIYLNKTKGKLEELLRRSQKVEVMGEVAGGIAHDFNNLLAIIIGNHDLMKRKIGDDSKLQKQLANAQAAAFRGAEITSRLLSLSRHSEELNSPVQISQVINDYEDFIRKSITANISLEMHIKDNLWLVDLNPGDFQDALINLSLNARDAMPTGGSLSFEVSNITLDNSMLDDHNYIKVGEYVEVKVSDSGMGMNQATIDKIFDPFFTTKEVGKGTGLGLAMVFGFVKRSKGTITVNSKEGVGTTFKIYFPRSQSMTDQCINSVEIGKQLPQGNETVLIVDDEKDLRAIAVSVLDDLGYTTICASNGDQAHEILSSNDTIDIVFSDVVMPGTMSGFDLADSVIKTKPNVKILLASGFTGKSNQADAVERWSENILSKPYRDIELAEAIRKALDE